MPDYARLRARAAAKIRAAGVPITLTKSLDDEYDPVAGQADNLGSKTFTGFAVQTEIVLGEENPAGSRLRSATCLLIATFDDAALVPQSGDALVIGGEGGWIVDTSGPVKPGAIVVIHEIRAKTV